LGARLKFNDAVIGIFFILFGGLLFYVTRDFPHMPGQAYGPDLFPRLIGAGMAFAGALLTAKGYNDRREGGAWVAPLDWMRDPRAVSNFVVVVAVLVFYILVSDRLGFLVTGFLCLFVLLAWLRGFASWMSSAVIAAASVLAIQTLFGHLLRVPLPRGLLQTFVW
jgi:putative tricarboxylic transport membrane protein